jgi:hypothetical protein
MPQNTREYRLINIKIAKAYRTTSHEALCVLTGIPPILTELENSIAVPYHQQKWIGRLI